MSDDDQARTIRMHAINTVLIELMSQRIKSEVGKLLEAGQSIDQINEQLASIVFYWDGWRETALQKCLAEFDDHEPPHTDNVRPLRPVN